MFYCYNIYIYARSSIAFIFHERNLFYLILFLSQFKF